MTPEQFVERMKAIYRSDRDTEYRHLAADELLCEALESLGYGEGVAIFREAPKWYA